MSCHENGCGWRGAYRRVKIHWDGTHSDGKEVFAVKCVFEGCMWFCHKNLKRFVYHMQAIHNVKPNSDTNIQYDIVVPRSSEHSQHCNFSASEATARRKERVKARRAQKTRENREKRLALKAAKKAATKPAKNVRKPAKVTRNINVNIQLRTSQQDTQSAGLEPVLEGFKAQPYVDGKRVKYTDTNLVAPKKSLSTNTQQINIQQAESVISLISVMLRSPVTFAKIL